MASPYPRAKENQAGVGCALWTSRLHRIPSPQPSQLICKRQGDGVQTWAMASDPPGVFLSLELDT